MFPHYVQPPLTFWDHYSNVMIVCAGFSVILFTLTYAFLFSWSRTRAGQAILGFVFGLVLLIWHTVVTKYFGGDWPFRDLLKAAIYTYIFGTTVALVWTLWSNWLRGNHPIDLKNREHSGPVLRLRSIYAWMIREGHRTKPLPEPKVEPHKGQFDDVSQ